MLKSNLKLSVPGTVYLFRKRIRKVEVAPTRFIYFVANIMIYALQFPFGWQKNADLVALCLEVVFLEY